MPATPFRIHVPFVGLLILTLAGGCYTDVFEGAGTDSSAVPAPAADGPRGVVVEVDPVDLEAWEPLAAEELFATVALETGVPADLLAAVAWVVGNLGRVDSAASGLQDGFGWFGLTDGARADAAEFSGLSVDLLGGRAGEVVAAAALLTAHRGEPDPDIGGDGWWPAVAAFSGLRAPFDEAFAGEVFEVLQRGRVSSTSDQADREDPDVLVIVPTEHTPLPTARVPESADVREYPRAVRYSRTPHAEPRPGRVDRIRLVASEASWAASLAGLTGDSGVGAHYLVRRADGEVTQLASSDQAVRLDGAVDDALVVMLAAPADGWNQWTPQLMEGSALLVAFLAATHDVDPGDISGAGLGDLFPWDGWRSAVACFQVSMDCSVPSGAPEVVPPGAEGRDGSSEARTTPGSIPNVPYFYQYANARFKSSSCQNTSVAMVLKWLGWSGTPDVLNDRFGKDLAQSPEGLAQVFNAVASEMGIATRIVPHRNGTIEGLRALLAAGKPTIVHGYMTGYGHVLVTTGYTGGEYVVNDPAGRWAQAWKGGYPYAYSASVGNGIRYGRTAFEQAIATSNGSSYLPLWYHELTNLDAPGPSAPVAEPPADEPEAATGEDVDDMLAADTGGASTGGGVADSTPDGGGPSGGVDGFDGWASVRFVTPSDGDDVGSPVLLRAVREQGDTTEFWSGPERLVAPRTDNPSDAAVTIWASGPRTLMAKSLSGYGTVLATHTIDVDVVATGTLLPSYRDHGDRVFDFSSSTDVPGVSWVEYSVNGYALTDSQTGESSVSGPDFALRYTFHSAGPGRLLVARGFSALGELLAEGSLVLDVADTATAAECGIDGTLWCGARLSANTSSSAGRSDVINGYPGIVGNYEGPELAYEFTGSGEVELSFVDSQPWLYDLDILVLEQAAGVCTPQDFVVRMFNSGTFEAQAGRRYTIVVDGFAGDQGAFTLDVACGG